MEVLGRETSAWPADEWGGSWGSAPPWFPPVFGHDGPDVELLDGLDQLICTLAIRSADILRRRLGQSPEGSQTLREIGDSYGLSRERIRQIEAASIRKFGSAKSRPDVVTARLTLAFRSLARTERGRYLRATFPEANTDVLAAVLGACGPATHKQLKAWIKAFERSQFEQDRRERQRLKADERWARFARGIIWPSGPCVGGRFPHTPCRAAGNGGGHRRSEKLGRSAQYDSGLEEHLLDLFDRSPEVVDYCEQPFRIEYTWSERQRDYIPDFAVRLADGRSMLVEAKPRTAWADQVNLAKWDAAIQRCERRGWGFIVSDNLGHPGDLLAGTDAGAQVTLEALTANGPADWPQLRHHWIDAGRSWTGLVATCLRYGFGLHHHPFEVRRAGKSPWIKALNRGAGGAA